MKRTPRNAVVIAALAAVLVPANRLLADFSTGFESPTYTPGPIDGQSGWTATQQAFLSGTGGVYSSATNMVVSPAAASSGGQGLRTSLISYDNLYGGFQVSGFNANHAVPTTTDATRVSFDLRINQTAQMPYIVEKAFFITDAQGYVIGGIDFQRSGNRDNNSVGFYSDYDNGGSAYPATPTANPHHITYNTSPNAVLTPNAFQTWGIGVDPQANMLRYYLNGTEVFAAAAFRGTSISGVTLVVGSQDALFYNQAPSSETIDLDNLSVAPLLPAALYFVGQSGSSLSAGSSYATTAAGTALSTTGPGGTTDVYFSASTAPAGALSATLAAPLAVNSLTFGTGPSAASTVAVSGAGTLTLNAGAGAYAAGTGIVKLTGSGAVTIGTPVALASSQSWTNQSATLLTVSGGVALGNSTLTLAGSGTTVVSGVISGGGGLIKSGAGTTTLSGANTYTGASLVQAGTLRATSAAYSNVLSNAGGLDVQGGRAVFDYAGGSSPANQIKAILANGYAQSTRFSTGQIRSTTLAANRTLGFGDSGSAVTVMLTVPGDANLDGVTDFNDFLVLQNNFNQTNTTFAQGNFNYDGLTDFNDFLILQNFFNQSVTGAALPVSASEVAALNAFAAANVPEPAGLALVGLGMAAGLRRSRRAAV